VKDALADMKKMTLTIVDGDFPREVVGGQNLLFGEYRMPARRNTPEYYDAKTKQPAGKREGMLKLGMLDPPARRNGGLFSAIRLGLIASISLGLAVVGWAWSRRQRN
jgi:hypothetical protein